MSLFTLANTINSKDKEDKDCLFQLGKRNHNSCSKCDCVSGFLNSSYRMHSDNDDEMIMI